MENGLNTTTLRPLSDLSLAYQAYEQLREAILTMALKPGELLVEQRLANALGISKTPIRQALQRLEQTGLVTVHPNKAYYVSRLTLQDAREILSVRSVLEGLAAAEACARLSPDDIEKLRGILCRSQAAFDNGDLLLSADIGHEMHFTLWEAAANGRLTSMIYVMADQYRRVRLVTTRVPGRLSRSLEEHERIFAALEARNAARAEQMMRKHLLQVYEDLELDANVSDDGNFRLPELAPVAVMAN